MALHLRAPSCERSARRSLPTGSLSQAPLRCRSSHVVITIPATCLHKCGHVSAISWRSGEATPRWRGRGRLGSVRGRFASRLGATASGMAAPLPVGTPPLVTNIAPQCTHHKLGCDAVAHRNGNRAAAALQGRGRCGAHSKKRPHAGKGYARAFQPGSFQNWNVGSCALYAEARRALHAVQGHRFAVALARAAYRRGGLTVDSSLCLEAFWWSKTG